MGDDSESVRSRGFSVDCTGALLVAAQVVLEHPQPTHRPDCAAYIRDLATELVALDLALRARLTGGWVKGDHPREPELGPIHAVPPE